MKSSETHEPAEIRKAEGRGGQKVELEVPAILSKQETREERGVMRVLVEGTLLSWQR